MMTPNTRKGSNLPPLTAKQLRDAERDKVYIFNVSPRTFRSYAANRMYLIPACPEGAEHSEPVEIPGIVYTSDVKKVVGLSAEYEWTPNDGVDVAKDIVGIAPFQPASANLTKLGVFISEHKHPSSAEIEKARGQWLDHCSQKVSEADGFYAVNSGRVDLGGGRSGSNIGPDHLEAAKALGIDRPWASKHERQTRCDECGTGNLPTAAFCKQCDNLLNEEAAKRKFPAKYAALGFGAPAAEPEPKRGPGRPRNSEAA